MNLTIIGTGFVGVVSAAVFADFGNKVWGLDIDEKKINALKQGKVPFYEPNLEELVVKGQKSGNLIFSTDYKEAVSQADIVMIAVGTPSAPDGQADLKYVLAAAKTSAPFLKPGAIVIVKSTVPPGTNQKVRQVIEAETEVEFYMASLPEFLKEGSAVYDTLNPDRVVIGASEPHVIETLKQLHKPLNSKVIVVKPESAQMSKYAANAYLAQRITFINQIANLCEHNGADVQEVISAMGPDKRIGEHYWYPGLGYGGSCFPKDVKELAAYSKSVGENNNLLVKIDQLNEERIDLLIKKFSDQIGGFKDKKVAVLGLSFKPNTDDIREAPALKVVPKLIKQGAKVVGYDPKVSDSIAGFLEEMEIAPNLDAAATGADVVMLLVEWSEFVNIDLVKLVSKMKGNVLIDTRNQFDPQKAHAAGLEYIGVGR